MSFNYNKKPYKSVEKKQINVTVGLSDADFIGNDHKIIQAAVEYVYACGGGIVKLLPGEYNIGNAVYLKSGVTLSGAGKDTVMKRIASAITEITADVDWYAWQVQVQDTSGFSKGGGLILSSLTENAKTPQASVHTILGIEDNILYIDSQPRMCHWMNLEAKAFSLSSIIRADYEEEFSVENVVLDGNREHNDFLDGNYGGAIFLQDCQRVKFKNVHIRDMNGDGISWQVCDDVTVEDCSIHNCKQLGLHPGSGSQRPVIKRNTISKCDTGLYWCWGVKNGIAEKNNISDCRIGISTGHRDTDNLMTHNTIKSIHEIAIFFRPERDAEKTAHRTKLKDNVIEDSAIGIKISRGLEDVSILNTRFINTNGKMSPAIIIEQDVIGLKMEGNIFESVEEEIREIKNEKI